ncbi:MAG TPA: TA system VapC family ribonuclease toxin [Terracidiphilus sp.]|nr:TA system VapC family ribonuclease toxin [Terracidiphilus sp.]
MIAVDSNVLVYAHREDSAWHDPAYACLLEVAEGRDPWAVPWPCLHEFMAIVTHPRIYAPPTPLETALEQVQAWLESPGLVLLGETESYWQQLEGLLRPARVCGAQVHDARVAALCLEHGITELWTADRDFSRFPALKVRNPLIG